MTKFHQNLSTVKGRSAGQTHTHTDTHRLTNRQTRLKIRALQVCNRANNGFTLWKAARKIYRPSMLVVYDTYEIEILLTVYAIKRTHIAET